MDGNSDILQYYVHQTNAASCVTAVCLKAAAQAAQEITKPSRTLRATQLNCFADCYFVEKAYNAEKAGAKALLVMDDRDEQLLTMAAPEDHPEIAKLREDITIPTMLVDRVRVLSPLFWEGGRRRTIVSTAEDPSRAHT